MNADWIGFVHNLKKSIEIMCKNTAVPIVVDGAVFLVFPAFILGFLDFLTNRRVCAISVPGCKESAVVRNLPNKAMRMIRGAAVCPCQHTADGQFKAVRVDFVDYGTGLMNFDIGARAAEAGKTVPGFLTAIARLLERATWEHEQAGRDEYDKQNPSWVALCNRFGVEA